MRVDPYSLQLFVAVVECGSIAKAAERAHIVPTAISKRIGELEALLDTALLQRSNRGVTPTPAGLAFLVPARRLLTEMDDLVTYMQDWGDGTRGQVRIYANISAINQFLPGQIASFLARYPGVQVHLQERISTDIVKAVQQNEADIGICIAGASSHDLDCLPYQDDELVLIAGRHHALAGRQRVAYTETLAYDYIGLHTGSSINTQLTRAAAEANLPLRLKIQVTGYDALARMVEVGLGISVMPRLLAERWARLGDIVAITLDELWASRRMHLCVRNQAALPPSAKLLVDHLLDPATQA